MFTHIIAEDGVLHVTVEGKFDLTEAKRNFLKVMEAVTKHGSTRVLIDGRKVSGEPTVIERFIYSEFAANVAVWGEADTMPSERPRFAYALVYPVLDPGRLGETVAANRGMRVRAFDTLPDALDWLKNKNE